MSSVDSIYIQPIDKTTVNQICSGQVVLNLATAVKELLENSIDAHANSIQIKLEEYGSESIEVIDNGCGVEEVNFQALTLKHHTSKITEFADLYSVETFGFRGEALSSLCALSDVTIITQHTNAVIGATLKFDHNGIITSKTKTLRKIGTTVKLENLFSPLPIRRTEFLKNLKREFSKMCNVLYAYGLQSTGVRITCTNNVSKAKLTTKESQKDESSRRSTNVLVMDTKGDSIESNILSIFGLKQKQNLLKVKEVAPSQDTLRDFGLENRKLDLDKFKLDGFISSCAHGCGRTNSDRQFYYINSRPVDNSKVSKLVNDIYHQYNNHQDPFVVLNIKVAVGSFDMNLTPDKRQILLQHENLLLATLKESLHTLFKSIPSTLDLHNVGLIKSSFEPKATTELPDRLKMLKANFGNYASKSDKKEQNVSRIDRFLEFRKQVKRDVNNSPDETKPEIEVRNEICNNQNEIVILVPKREENLEKSDETKCRNQSADSDEAMNRNLKVIYETGNDCDDSKVTSQKCEEMKMEIEDKEVSAVTSSKREGVSECKRKILSQDSGVSDLTKMEEECQESEENESKRMKLDEGLTENEKSRRKVVMCNASLDDIKNLWFIYSRRSEEKGKSTVDVKFLADIKPQSNARAENELKKEIQKDDFRQMDIIGQFNLGFIIAKLKSDIFIIDQHASDEKYNFETLKRTTVMQTQRLINPEKLELTIDKEELMVQHRDVFKRNGFDFVFDENEVPTRRISLTTIPMSKNWVFGKEEVDELLFFLENAPDAKVLRPSRVDAMFASRACRKSVMIGTPLNRQEMRKIVDHMGEIEHPWNCPHGRPTMRHLVNLNMIVSQ